MGMRTTILKGIGLAAGRSLASTYFKRGSSAFEDATNRAMFRISPTRRRRARTRAAMTGLGAAAVAIPLGLWLGRRVWGLNTRNRSTTTSY